MTMEERNERLEHQNRRMKAAVAVMVLVVAGAWSCQSNDRQCRPLSAGERRTIAVGESPNKLRLTADGTRLLVLTAETISVIDLRTCQETARISPPVRLVDGDGSPTYGYLSGFDLDNATDTLWVVSSEGQIFTVNLQSREYETVFEDNSLFINDVVWDESRRRAILATAGRTIYAYANGTLDAIARARFPEVVRVKIQGSLLYFISSVEVLWGRGKRVTSVGSLDLKRDVVLHEKVLDTGTAHDLIVVGDRRVWVTDSGYDRLLEFGPDMQVRSTRPTPDFSPYRIASNCTRALVVQLGTPLTPVLEYHVSRGRLTDFPIREYPAGKGSPWSAIPLPGGGIAAVLDDPDIVVLIHGKDGRPFSGFSTDYCPEPD